MMGAGRQLRKRKNAVEITPRLGITYLAPAQAQKHVTVNEALRRLDAVAQLSVKSATVVNQPASPHEGDAYILPPGKSGAAWSGFADGSIAVFQDGDWNEIASREGFLAYRADLDQLWVNDGSVWSPTLGGGAETASKFGVNAIADATNRFVAKADASLFSHDDTTPGTGDHRLKINKSAAGRTGGVVFQTSYSGRAEIGLLGDESLRFKLSADGAAWSQALVFDAASGKARFGSELSTPGWSTSDPHVTIGASGVTTPLLAMQLCNDSSVGAQIRYFRSRGAATAPAALQSGDVIGVFNYFGFDGASYLVTSSFRAVVENAVSAGSVPTSFIFYTGATGTVSSRLTIRSNGDVGVGVDAPLCKLDVDGAIRVKTFAKAALPSAAAAGQLIYVSDEIGGPVIAFSDGTHWRRVTDRAIVA